MKRNSDVKMLNDYKIDHKRICLEKVLEVVQLNVPNDEVKRIAAECDWDANATINRLIGVERGIEDRIPTNIVESRPLAEVNGNSMDPPRGTSNDAVGASMGTDKAATGTNMHNNELHQVNDPTTSTVNKIIGNASESDLQRAIEASMQSQGGSQGTAGPPLAIERPPTTGAGDDMEDEMQRAIAASLETQSSNGGLHSLIPVFENPDPREQVRNSSLLPGLANVGNTCFFNSLLHSYLSIPQLRELVFAYRPIALSNTNVNTSVESREREQAALFFLEQLQRVFARLCLTDRRLINPSAVLDAMRGVASQSTLIGNNTGKVGTQEDASEFSDYFVNLLKTALKPLDIEKGYNIRDRASGTTKTVISDKRWEKMLIDEENPIASLFFGETLLRTLAYEENGSDASVEHRDQFRSIFLEVNSDISDLYTSLDVHTQSGVRDSFVTALGRTVSDAPIQTWFSALPPVLTFHLKRVNFRRADGGALKEHGRFAFDQRIYMDRYLAKNMEDVTSRRDLAKTLRHQFSKLEEQLRAYHIDDTELSTALSVTGRYLRGRLPGISVESSCKSSPAVEEAANLQYGWLDICQKDVEATMQSLKLKMNEVKKKLDSVFADDSMCQVAYRLHAVLVHDGERADSGHYIAFVNSGIEIDGKRSWIKYNDRQVNIVSEDDVFLQSYGGGGTRSSAYYLVYIDELHLAKGSQLTIERMEQMVEVSEMDLNTPNTVDMEDEVMKYFDELRISVHELVPSSIREDICADNRLLAMDILAWDVFELSNTNHVVSSTLTSRESLALTSRKRHFGRPAVEQVNDMSDFICDPSLLSASVLAAVSGENSDIVMLLICCEALCDAGIPLCNDSVTTNALNVATTKLVYQSANEECPTALKTIGSSNDEARERADMWWRLFAARRKTASAMIQGFNMMLEISTAASVRHCVEASLGALHLLLSSLSYAIDMRDIMPICDADIIPMVWLCAPTIVVVIELTWNLSQQVLKLAQSPGATEETILDCFSCLRCYVIPTLTKLSEERIRDTLNFAKADCAITNHVISLVVALREATQENWVLLLEERSCSCSDLFISMSEELTSALVQVSFVEPNENDIGNWLPVWGNSPQEPPTLNHSLSQQPLYTINAFSSLRFPMSGIHTLDLYATNPVPPSLAKVLGWIDLPDLSAFIERAAKHSSKPSTTAPEAKMPPSYIR